jgi:hypothetical protein
VSATTWGMSELHPLYINIKVVSIKQALYHISAIMNLIEYRRVFLSSGLVRFVLPRSSRAGYFALEPTPRIHFESPVPYRKNT